MKHSPKMKILPSMLLFFVAFSSNSHGWMMHGSSSPSSSQSIISHHHIQAPRSDNINNIKSKDKLGGATLPDRRLAILSIPALILTTAASITSDDSAWAKDLQLDVNNAVAREFTAFPGLYPTIAAKVVKGAPYTSKKEIYAILNEVEGERLRQYDKALVIRKEDKALQQFKNSQICKYECKGRVSDPYRDSQIRAVQAGREGRD